MSQTAVTHGVPQHPTDLPKGYKPVYAAEMDYTFPMIGKRRRLRMVKIICPDQNSTKTLIEDLGEPTGEDGVFVPCDGVVEMAHVHELIDFAKSRMARRAELRQKKLLDLHEDWEAQLLDRYEQEMANRARRSVFGRYYSKERTYIG